MGATDKRVFEDVRAPWKNSGSSIMKNEISTNKSEAPIRLQKFLSNAGVSSRRKAEELISQGLVRINGKVVKELGVRVDPNRDVMTIDGKKIRINFKYVILHKPVKVLCSRDDPEGRPTVIDMLPDMGTQLYPVGRLDYDASGLVLLTNDGDVAMAFTHPSFKTPRIYLVKAKGQPDEKDLERLRGGVHLDDGAKTLPAKVRQIEYRGKGKSATSNTWLKFILHEGRNRQIKRMCLAVRHPALRIHRVTMGPLKLGDLPVGAWRYATKEEIKELQKLAQKQVEKTSNKKK